MTMTGNNFRPIHYLGSKLRMLSAIKDAIDDVDITKGTVLDLFSGSGTVSNYLLQYRNVISVDIQHYSKVLCEASMSYLNIKFDLNAFSTKVQKGDFSLSLLDVFKNLIKYEEKCAKDAEQGNLSGLYEIIESGSIYIFENEESNASPTLSQVLALTQNSLKCNENLKPVDYMVCRYYGGLYFSYKQALWLDIIEHYIFEFDGLLRTKLLAALLSTASEIVNTVGKQFAQPLKVRNAKGELKQSLYAKIQRDRNLDVIEIFKKWAEHYLSLGYTNHSYQIICDDYVSALKHLENSNISVIYADPPYTRYHYSRYYHVLETMCLRDNPQITTTFPNGNGGISRAIYRADRHQSPFCIKSQAEEAFNKLFEGVQRLQVPLVLSYSPFDASKAVTPRLQTIDQLVEKAESFFSDVSIVSPGEFTHSKLNSVEKNFEANHEAELLIVCK